MAEINKINKKDGTVTGQQVPEETFFAGKTENPETEVPEEALVGTEEDVQAMMEKFDRESNTRHFAGIPQKIIRYCLVAFSLFCIYMNLIAVWDERTRRASFVGLLVLMAFALYPARKQDGRVKRLNHIPWYDGVLGILGSSCFFYFVFNVDRIVRLAGRISDFDVLVGVVGILILLEACRRVTGIPIVVVAGCFMVYSFFSGITLKKIIFNLFYTTEGVIGTPISVCSTFIVLFIIFGAFLERTGIADFFIQTANSIVGGASGGPAKVAVIASALEGMVSGSSVANTVGSGAVTIPLMKRTGYKAEFAGAVEAAASTGGQIMPPIMGAAAFLMAEMVGVPYSTVAVKAILPALLYFTGIFVMVHLEAKKEGLRGLSKEELPNFWKLCGKSGYLLLPLVLLITLLAMGWRTMATCAMVATAAAILVSMLRQDTRLNFSRFCDALENAARSTIGVGVACATAGIIAGVVTMTGLGQVLITAIVKLAGDYTIIALFLTMIACIILGMGVPTTANYVIMATTCAPILIAMDIPPMAAHMFVFYFGIVADITPPVALAAYAGAAIAKGNPMKTGLNATRLAIAAFIIPYIFALSPAMLFIDTTVLEVIQIIFTSFIGMFMVAIGLEGYLLTHVKWPWRIISILGGLCLIHPGLATDIIGILVLVSVVMSQIASKRKHTAKIA
ncbi:MAG: TRAP transporter permease [Peptococcaceae bacterium]|nr:TRAP transporter permease [Peptococcaceae bacterium]